VRHDLVPFALGEGQEERAHGAGRSREEELHAGTPDRAPASPAITRRP